MSKKKSQNLNKKRVLWLSNAPWAATGYGVITGLVAPRLQALGHEAAVLANYGLDGTKITAMGVTVYPRGRDARSNDFVQACADDHNADLTISFYDAWPLEFASRPVHRTPWVSWAPVDHETATPPIVDALRFAQGVVSMSQHGHAALNDAGVDNHLIPLGVDTEVYSPGSQAEARAELELAPDAFIVGMVAANRFFPGRKNVSETVTAFSRFVKRHPNSTLFLHMCHDDSARGVHLLDMVKFLGIEENVLFANQFWLRLGYPSESMASLFRAFDVLANPAKGEGFGIPIIESMACGTPVIGTNVTSMPELIGDSGWLIEGSPMWSAQVGYYRYANADQIDEALEIAFEAKQNGEEMTARRIAARDHAMKWNIEQTVRLWDEYLDAAPWSQVVREEEAQE